MSIALGNPKGPVSRQVAERLRRLIARRYKPGDVLPTYRTLATDLGVGLRSIFDAMGLLATQGLVKPVRRLGTLVVRCPGRGADGLSLVAVVPRGNIDAIFLGYRGRILSGIGARIEQSGLSLMLFPQREGSMVPVKEVIASGADAILMMGVIDADYVRACMNTDLPVVLVDQADDALPVDAVVCDNPAAAQRVVAHLRELGHQRIAYASSELSPLADFDNRERRSSFAAALAEAGLAPSAPDGEFSFTGPATPNTAVEGFLAGLRRRRPAPTAVVTDSESTLRCLLACAPRVGLSVPGDLSLATLAMPTDEWAGTGGPLTGCCIRFADMGELSVEALEQRSRTPAAATRRVRAPFVFCPGETAGRPRAGR